MSPQKKSSRPRGRPADQSPIYVTSLRPKYPDPDLLASTLLAHYRNITGKATDQKQHLFGNGTVSDRADNRRDGDSSAEASS